PDRLPLPQSLSRSRHEFGANTMTLLVMDNVEILNERAPLRIFIPDRVSEPDQFAVLFGDHRAKRSSLLAGQGALPTSQVDPLRRHRRGRRWSARLGSDDASYQREGPRPQAHLVFRRVDTARPRKVDTTPS